MKSIANWVTLGLVHKDDEEPIFYWGGITYGKNDGSPYYISSIFDVMFLLIFWPMTLVIALQERKRRKSPLSRRIDKCH